LRDDVSGLFSFGDDYFFEVAVLPTTGIGRVRCEVLFRLSYDMLEFRRVSMSRGTGELFVATPSLFAEAMNSEGVIVGRGTWFDTVRTDTFASTNARNRFVCGAITLALRPGWHTVRYSLDIGRPGSGFTRVSDSFVVRGGETFPVALGSPLFVRTDDIDTLRLESIDGNARFGSRLRCFVPIGGRMSPTAIRYELHQLVPEATQLLQIRSGSAERLSCVNVGSPIADGSNIHLPLSSPDDTTCGMWGAFIEIGADDLAPGAYALVVVAGSSADEIADTVRFSIRWIDSPFSLSRVDYAIRALYPIASDDQIDRMLTGDRRRQTEALNSFWADRDPTPATRFNEAMAEYYRRVDYAYLNFRSIDRRDGVATDRGKIYILNGPPTEVTRELDPRRPPREVWLYRNRVAQEFVFSDEGRNGDMRLVSYRDL